MRMVQKKIHVIELERGKKTKNVIKMKRVRVITPKVMRRLRGYRITLQRKSTH